MATEAYPLDLEEDYLLAEEVPRWSDRRAELIRPLARGTAPSCGAVRHGGTASLVGCLVEAPAIREVQDLEPLRPEFSVASFVSTCL